MRIIKKKLGEYAELTGYLHELNDETDNIKDYPAILIFPGGSFRTCSFLESEPIALAYLAEGYQAFTLKYTTVTDKENATIEDPMTDAQKALEWIRDCREEYCIGKGQLALLGFSGGAHLAAAVATHGPQRPDVAQWFQLSVRWLKEMLGEFTVYGVNDGRIGKYSIDTRVCELLESPETKELVLTYLPMLREELPVFIKDWITPRILNKNQKSLSQEKLEELDQKLLAL